MNYEEWRLLDEWLNKLAELIMKVTGMTLSEALIEAEDHMMNGRPDAEYLERMIL
jgi:hypothetical protein